MTKTDPEGFTREWWLENNKVIAEAEGLDEAEVFYNQIETRLRLHEDIRNEDDEKLGSAYVRALDRYEAQGDFIAMGLPWSPFTAKDLAVNYNIPMEEAEVLVRMVYDEYVNN